MMYEKIENSKEATNNVSADLKARIKVRLKHFNFKKTEVCYV